MLYIERFKIVECVKWIALLLLLPTDPCIPWGDLSDQGEGAGLRVGKVQALHLHHHLPNHVVAAVPVKGQHHKVQRKDLENGL